MSIFKRVALPVVAVAALGLALPAHAKGVRFECRDQLARQDVSAKAKFERDGARRKFTVEVEAALRSSFRAGDILKVRVEDAKGTLRVVGQIRLVRGVRDLVGKLDLDTVREPGSRPFPASFPAVVGAGTEVQVGAQLACALQRR